MITAETLFGTRRISLVVVFLACVASCCGALTPATFGADAIGGVIYVSPQGDDANDGSSSTSAVATLERARDLARERRDDGVEGMITIKLAKGVFARETPFELDSRDSNTEYVGDDDMTTLSGGIEINGWRVASEEERAKFPATDGDIWRADLPDLDGVPLFFEQLFVSDRRATRSRFPNEGFLQPQEIWEEFSMNAPNRSPEQGTRQELRAKEGDLDPLALDSLSSEKLRFAQFIVHHHWDTTRRIILGYDPQTRALKAQGSPMKSWNPWRDSSLYYVENVPAAFDEPGEWFYDGVDRCAYYRPLPGESIDSTKFIAPRPGLNQLLRVAGSPENPVRNVKFKNIRFVETDAPRRLQTMKNAELPEEITGDLTKPGPSQFEPAQSAFFTVAVLDFSEVDGATLENCEAKRLGEYGLWFRNCSNCVVSRTTMDDLGAGAVRVGGGRMDRNNRVQDCVMTRGGRFFASATAVWIGQNTEEIEILHNEIRDFYYTGVSVGWVWGYNGGHAFRNRIEFNRISKIGQGTMSDMGGVYTLGTSTGTRVCNNVIFDVSSYAYGGWGLYPDEGSEGILFENNLVYDTTDGSFHQHYGKENIVRNNILARSRINPARQGQPPHQIAITRVEDHLSTTFERNIVYWKEGIALGYQADGAKAIYKENLWYNAGGEALFSGKTHDEWSKETGKDEGGIVADPMFVDPDANDFHLKPDSPALKLGFIPFDYEKAGPRK